MHAIRHLALAVIAASTLCAAAPPNIIFILSDDLAQGDVGAYGQKIIHPPGSTGWPGKAPVSPKPTVAPTFAPRAAPP